LIVKMSVKVKICGITNVADGLAAAEAGADILGFVFCEQSSRNLSVAQAAAIISELPSFVLKAGVFVDAPEEFVARAVGQCSLSLLQFHGDEPPEYCTQFGIMSMKAFRIRDGESLKRIPDYLTEAWLLDAYTAGKPGGTGEIFNWDLAVEAKKFGRPVFLAGGLTPENVTEAVARVQPFGIDVSTGVEASPGRKDHQKVAAFIRMVKAASSQSDL